MIGLPRARPCQYYDNSNQRRKNNNNNNIDIFYFSFDTDCDKDVRPTQSKDITNIMTTATRETKKIVFHLIQIAMKLLGLPSAKTL